MPVINNIAGAQDPVPVGSQAPCAWTIDTSCCEDWASFDVAIQERATAWATYILYALSGRRFGVCEITVRPCGPRCRASSAYTAYPVTTDGYWAGSAGIGAGLLSPFIRNGTWFNCGCSGSCNCTASCEAWLPGPVATVTEVFSDGVLVPSTSYRVDDGEWLVRTDGECWPECQDLDSSNPTDPNTLFVTYGRGVPVPVAGQIAAGILACEFAKACTGQACALPQNLSSISRQGIEVSLPDPSDLLQQGLTGIADVDLWIMAVNPYRKAGRSRVYSPDIDYPRQRTF